MDFWSDDRPDSSSGGFISMRWNTPVGDCREIGGLRLGFSGGFGRWTQTVHSSVSKSATA